MPCHGRGCGSRAGFPMRCGATRERACGDLTCDLHGARPARPLNAFGACCDLGARCRPCATMRARRASSGLARGHPARGASGGLRHRRAAARLCSCGGRPGCGRHRVLLGRSLVAGRGRGSPRAGSSADCRSALRSSALLLCVCVPFSARVSCTQGCARPTRPGLPAPPAARHRRRSARARAARLTAAITRGPVHGRRRPSASRSRPAPAARSGPAA